MSIRNFVADLGHFALNWWRARPDKGGSFLIITAERDTCNGVASDKLQPVILRDFTNIAPQEFCVAVIQKYQRLNLLGSRGL